MQRTRPWELSEEVWERAEPLLPPPKPRPKGGRPPRSDRQMLGAILYVLRICLADRIAMECAAARDRRVHDGL